MTRDHDPTMEVEGDSGSVCGKDGNPVRDCRSRRPIPLAPDQLSSNTEITPFQMDR